MYYLVYNSYAAIEFGDDKLKKLLIQARDKNLRLGITGMLFYFSNQFIQLIEGDEATVKQLAVEIAEDPRHMHFIVLKEGHTDKRYFPDWSMGFKSVSPANFEDVSNFKDLNGAAAQDKSKFLSLLNVMTAEL